MKRKLLVLLLGFLLAISCKQVSESSALGTPILQEEPEVVELSDEEKREVYLRSLMNEQNTLVEDEKIENDLLNVLKELHKKAESTKIIPTLQKIDSDLFGLSNISFFSVGGEEIEENIKLSLYKIGSGEKSGFAITCNDLRVGEILALVEEGEFDENNPFIELVSSNIREYINQTVQDWQELKKEKEYKKRSIWEGLVTSKEYTYENWKANDKKFKKCLLKTQWGQNPIYNDVIAAFKGGDFPAGCVGVAIAQIMAFHQYPKKYYGTSWEDFNAFKKKLVTHFPVTKYWNGDYDWWLLTWESKVADIGEDYPIYRLQIASLMYEIAESCNASYSEDGTGMSIEDYTRGLLFHDYITGTCTKTPMPEKPISWDAVRAIFPPWVKINPPTHVVSFNAKSNAKDNNELKSVGPKGNRIRYTDYSFDSVKASIDNLCPVLIKGRTVNKEKDNGKITFEETGHAWVIDGYCNLTCDAVHNKTKERKTITADYVHCNVGWRGSCNGYYISNIFTFGIRNGLEDCKIRNSWPGLDDYYKYNIKIFPNLIPKNKLGTYSQYPWNYHWEALW